MKSKEYIIEKINFLVNKFNDIKIVYKYSSFSDRHYLDVSPSSFFDENKEFHKDEMDITMEFLNTFLGEDIIFMNGYEFSESEIEEVCEISNCELIKMDNIYKYTIIGKSRDSVCFGNNLNYSLAA